MTLQEKIMYYSAVLAKHAPPEVLIPLYNELIEHVHKFKLESHIIDDRPY